MSAEKVNWEYYVCRKCKSFGDAHMVSEQARLRLCESCYAKYLEESKKKGEGS